MAKKKKVVVMNVTRDEAEDAFAQYARAEAHHQLITSKMDVEFTRIRESHQTDLTDLETQMEQAFTVMYSYATQNRDELFAKKKSLEMVHGTIGFRTGTPALKTKKGFTWAAVTNLLKEFLPKYVRTVEEPAKDRLLADRDKTEVCEALDKCGIEVRQDEAFYIEPKKEDGAQE